MRYTLCEAEYPESLISAVNVLITEGWIPIGGIAVTQWESGTPCKYIQAMLYQGDDHIQDYAE